MTPNKSLLVEYQQFVPNTELIKEAITNNNPIRVTGVLQRAGSKNQNGRVYPMDILKREADMYNEEFVKQRRALGECDHPDSSVVSLANASHHITKMWWDGSDLMGEIEILSTPSGNILKNILASGIIVGISSRGLGSIREVFTEDQDKYLEVQKDFELVAFDFVSNPSTQGAYMYPVNESKDNNLLKNNIDKDKKINSIVSQLICDIQGVCHCS
jgi:hypothetical protein